MFHTCKGLVLTNTALQWISAHFGHAGLETSWELGNHVELPEFVVLLLLVRERKDGEP